jgi:hypothetical protein
LSATSASSVCARAIAYEGARGRGYLGGRADEMMGLELGQIAVGGLLVERAALGGDDVPAAQVGNAVMVGGERDSKIVARIRRGEPGVPQMIRDAIAGEAELHQLEEAPLRRAAAQPAAPVFRRAQHELAVAFEPLAIGEIEPAIGVDERRV